MKKHTAYEIINQGMNVCPGLNRDDYYEEEFVKAKEIRNIIDLYFDMCMGARKVPKKEELKKKMGFNLIEVKK